MLYILTKLIVHHRGVQFIIGFYFIIALFFSILYFNILPFLEGTESIKSIHLNSNSPISFVDCLYFSITSQATVGYGDLIPITNSTKILVSIQVFFGYFYLCFSISIFTARTILKSKKLTPLLRYKNTLIE